jgi:short-subunit dehydrogenase
MAAPQVVLVTGASSGIGRAVAQEASRLGHHLVLMARTRWRLEQTADECRGAGAASVTAFSVNVADNTAVASAVDDTYHRLGAVDIVVQSAGVAAYGRFEALPAEVFDAVIATNVQGSANVARAVLPRMREANWGRIYLVGSVIGTIGVPEMSPYVVSKWAIRALARSLQLENRDRPGVCVTLVTPGGVDTPIYRTAANFSGYEGRPPPPVYSPETVARAVVASFAGPPPRLNVGITNPVMTLGFTLLPRLYDALVGPLARRITKSKKPVSRSAGNVLSSSPAERS